ncbi:PAS domain S-box protein [Siansivirga zeaxanthinifaciens]|uniref:histidine kinase n=1 Tax=Siansivirga zeaxanthinifaciens CC-SAMT-1 TaxID=1454006 RepID=A0A0C5WAC3_9FLAO|nr:PAS domain S-box protein [Siansivirga zeaxanthinifaciens]AJR04083.1 histidine kinase [Siansivirga zeaxanthinifaciens CC-SAMT-1]
MSKDKIDILKRALAREKSARKQAEKILEKKSTELYNANIKLEKLNADLESLLKRSDSQLQGVFENIVDAYVIMDLNFNLLKMNKSAMKMLGFDSEKVDYNLKNMVLPNDYARVTNSFKKLLKEGSLTDFEIKIKNNKNEFIITHINASIIYDDGNAVAAQGIIRDITKFKENEIITDVINDITKSILGTMDIYEISSKITQQIAKFLNTDDCVIYSVNHCENLVEQIAASDEKISETGDIVNRLKFEIGKGVVGTVAKTGKSKLLHDTSKEPLYIVDIARNYSELTVPIIIENEVIAVIDSEHPDKNHFTNVQLQTIENVAEIIGLKIKNAISLNENSRVQKRLLKSEKLLRKLISSFENGILLEDENRKIVLTNSRFCEMFNIPISPKEMIGADCTNAAEQSKNLFQKPELFVNRINDILQKKETVLADELSMIDGKILERDFIPLYVDNDYTGHLWCYRDVTLQKKHRQSLEAQRQKYRSIIANMNLGILEVDNHDRVLMCNHSFSKISGYKEEELLGKFASEFFLNNKSLKLLKKQNKKRLAGHSNSYEIEVKNKRGENRIWLISGAPNYNLNGEVIGSIGIHLDITEQKKLQIDLDNLVKLLKNKNNELQEYAQIVSHDLKSPLRNISALTTWIKEDNLANFNEVSLKHFDHLEQTLERMEALITGILKYSSINSDSGQNETFNLNNLVEDIIKTLHVPKHINISIKNVLPTIYADKIKFNQLFQNLLNNAVNHIDKKVGLIEIGCESKRSHYQFYVKDNGVGIDKKYHDQIFKIFYYITKNKYSTGIGLSIVKKITEIYGGTIWLSSEPTVGTVFYFTIKK